MNDLWKGHKSLIKSEMILISENLKIRKFDLLRTFLH